MMLTQIIDLNPVEPCRIGWRLALGQRFNSGFLFQRAGAVADMTGQNPQLAFRPRSKGGVLGYDLDMSNPAGGYGSLEIDGAAINDPRGYTVEMYSRNAAGTPLEMIALGTVAVTGGAYSYSGPFAPLTLPVVAGPPGAPGAPGADSTVPGPAGQRGSMWTTGAGTPTVPGGVEGDMYLNETNGDVYRWSGSAWAKGTF